MKPSMPTYDPAKDGNLYDWIVKQSQVVRAERQAVAASHCLFTKADRLAMAVHDAAMDAEDENRLKNLRRQYDPARNRATK